MRKPRVIVIRLQQDRGSDTATLIEHLRSGRCYEVMETFAARRQLTQELLCHIPWARQLGLAHGADALVLGKIETSRRPAIQLTLLDCATGQPIFETKANSIERLARSLMHERIIRRIQRNAQSSVIGMVAAVHGNEIHLTTARSAGFRTHELVNLALVCDDIQDPCAPWASMGHITDPLGRGEIHSIQNGSIEIRYFGCRPITPGEQIKVSKY